MRSENHLLDSQSKFVDHEFLPNRNSIYNNKYSKTSLMTKLNFNIRIFKWLRAEDIKFSSDKNVPLTLKNSPCPDNVVQGAIGSCWYLSALAALVTKKDIFDKLFITKECNEQGIYQFNLCIRGQWNKVVVDDFLPCYINKKVVFAHIDDNQLFVALLEKCLAKIHGSYSSIILGSCAEGLQTLTGGPCIKLSWSTKEFDYDQNMQHWNQILEATSKGFIMTCVSDYNIFIVKNGIYEKHIYSVLDVRELNYENRIARFIKLRNPWGRNELRGELTNKWGNWPDEIKDQISKERRHSKGTFWIRFEELLKYFSEITICKTRPHWKALRLSSVFYNYSEEVECFTINVNKPGEFKIDIELFADGRTFDRFDRTTDPIIDLCLIICKIEEDELKCIEFSHDIQSYISFETVLTQGKYILFATSLKAIILSKRENSNKNLFKYNLIIHSQETLDIKKVTKSAEIVSEFFFSFIDFSAFQSKINIRGDFKVTNLITRTLNCIMVENKSNKYCFDLVIDTSNKVNIDQTRDGSQMKDHLCPGEKKILLCSIPMVFRKSHIYNCKLIEHAFICQRKKEISQAGELKLKESNPFWGLKVNKSKIEKYIYD